jgi:hypothetical protein
MWELRTAFSKFSIALELVGFFWANRWWWLVPMLAVLLLLGVLLLFAQTSAVAPFIYTLF